MACDGTSDVEWGILFSTVKILVLFFPPKKPPLVLFSIPSLPKCSYLQHGVWFSSHGVWFSSQKPPCFLRKRKKEIEIKELYLSLSGVVQSHILIERKRNYSELWVKKPFQVLLISATVVRKPINRCVKGWKICREIHWPHFFIQQVGTIFPTLRGQG